MKILFLYSKLVLSSDAVWALMELGYEVETCKTLFSFCESNEEEEKELTGILEKNNYDWVMTYNYIGSISNVCMKENIKYVSWVWDSPWFDLYNKSIENDCNYIFLFDKNQYKDITKRFNLKHVYHLPLAANLSRIGSIEVKKEDEQKYYGQIAFVGRLNKNSVYNEVANLFRNDIREHIDKSINDIVGKWPQNSIYSYLKDVDIEYFNNKIAKTNHNKYLVEDNVYYGSYIIAKKANEIDRMNILNMLASNFDVSLYTDDNTEGLCDVNIRPYVDYNTDMTKVFYSNKINLNITLRTIETGVPQRVYDVLASGGFLLTNYQQELEELFEPDKDLVMFYDYEDMFEKAEYYLCHERERIDIAMNGYKKVRDKHSYINRMEYIVDKIMEN